MKFKILIGVLGVTVCCTLGTFYFQQVKTSASGMQSVIAQAASASDKYTSLVAQSNDLASSLSQEGKSIFLDNEQMANVFASIEGGTIKSITAYQESDGSDPIEIITIDNTADVKFFTDTVDLIKYTFQITDRDSFLNSVRNTLFIPEEMNIDVVNNTAEITIPSSYKLYNGSLDSASGMVEDNRGVNTEESQASTESTTTNDNSSLDSSGYLVDSSDDTTNSGASPSSTNSETDNTAVISVPANGSIYDASNMGNSSGSTISNTEEGE